MDEEESAVEAEELAVLDDCLRVLVNTPPKPANASDGGKPLRG